MPDKQNGMEFLNQLILDNYKDLERFAAKQLKDRDSAKDAVQTTFLVAQKKINDLIASPSPRGWLFNTLKNIIGNMMKQQKRFLEVLIPIADCNETDEIRFSIEAKYRGMVDDESLQILIWIYCDDCTYKEVADRLGIELSACKKRVQRAKEKLKYALEQEK